MTAVPDRPRTVAAVPLASGQSGFGQDTPIHAVEWLADLDAIWIPL